jgi:hypothetical protein
MHRFSPPATFGVSLRRPPLKALCTRGLAAPRVAVGAFLILALMAPLAVDAQATGDDDDLTFPREVLTDAINARVKPLSDFSIPADKTEWKVGILRLTEDAFFFDYVIAAGAPFQVQAILCDRQEGERKTAEVDTTILGPTETAGEFYEANLTYAYFPPDQMPPCMLNGMTASVREGTIRHEWDAAERDAHIATSPERAVRHMANWARYLAKHRNDRRRAAQFFAGALQQESDQLLTLAGGIDLDRTVRHLRVLERILPPELFDLQVPLTAAQAAQASRFLQQRLQLRRKVAAIDDGGAALIQRDQALLLRYGGVR